MTGNRSPGAPFGQGSGGAGDFEAVGDRLDPPDGTALNQVKQAVHIVIGLRAIGLFVKTDAGFIRLNELYPYPGPDAPRWNDFLRAVRQHVEAGDEFAPIRLTGHAFKNLRSRALAADFMQAGVTVSNQTFMADDNDPHPHQHRRHRKREWLWF